MTYLVPQTVVSQRILEEMVVLDIGHGRYYELNATAADLFAGIEAGRSLVEILVEMTSAYPADPAVINADLLCVINELVDLGLLVPQA